MPDASRKRETRRGAVSDYFQKKKSGSKLSDSIGKYFNDMFSSDDKEKKKPSKGVKLNKSKVDAFKKGWNK